MVCDDCAKALAEVNTMGGFGACCVCGEHRGLGGPITAAEQHRLREAYAAVWDRAFNAGCGEDFWRTQNPYRDQPAAAPIAKTDPSRDVALAAIVQVLLPRLTPREVGLVVDRLRAWGCP